MMGAVQPFISGAISKTVNMPEEATVEDVEALHLLSWELGLKAVAIYRDNCKVGQPLSTAKKDDEGAMPAPTRCRRRRRDRADRRAGHPPAGPPEAAAHPHAAGPSSSGWPTARASPPSASTPTAGRARSSSPSPSRARPCRGSWTPSPSRITYGLQYGVPLRAFVEAFTNMRFEPAGMTDDPDIRFASSIMDYLFRRLALEYLTYDERAELGIFSIDERLQPTLPGVEESRHRDLAPAARWPPTRRRSRRSSELATQWSWDRGADAPAQRHHRPGGIVRPRASRPRPASRRADVHAVRRADDPGRQLPRLPELRQHQRLQLIRLASRPGGRGSTVPWTCPIDASAAAG